MDDIDDDDTEGEECEHDDEEEAEEMPVMILKIKHEPPASTSKSTPEEKKTQPAPQGKNPTARHPQGKNLTPRYPQGKNLTPRHPQGKNPRLLPCKLPKVTQRNQNQIDEATAKGNFISSGAQV